MVVMGGTGNVVLHSKLETQNSYVEVCIRNKFLRV